MRGSLPIGTIVKGYRVDSVLSAAGNFAAVYLAYDTDAARVARRREKVAGRLQRWKDRYSPAAARTPLDPGPYVALKEYAPRDLSLRQGIDVVARPDKVRVFEWGRDRFKRESEFLSEHSHPNVVAVYDRFSAHGTEYYVMERLHGGSLEGLLDGEGIQVEAQVRAWLLPILNGLASVERRDANHLDISPGNIMFRQPGGDPVLVDFGAARIPGAAQGHSTRFIVDEHFAAPEKFQHGSRELDARCDIYSLGAVANFALTGELPPTGNMRVAGSADMSGAAARRRGERATPELLRAIDRAFAYSPATRFPDATAFAEACTVQRKGMAGIAVPTDPDSGIWVIRLLAAAALLVVLVLALLLMELP
jgi:serine/threonine protein kinase